MILNPLQRIEVIKGARRVRTHSVGYFVAQNSAHPYNRWYICTVFTRIGKAGKPRVEPISALTRMIEYDTMDESDYNIIRDVAVREGLDSDRTLGDPNYIKVRPIPPISKDIVEISNNEFMAYIVALSMLIHKLVDGTSILNMTSYYLVGRHRTDFYRSRFNLSRPNPDELGYYILSGIQHDKIAAKRGRDGEGIKFSEAFAVQTDTIEKRRAILNRLRQSLCMTRNYMRDYEVKMEGDMSDIRTRINNVLRYYRKN